MKTFNPFKWLSEALKPSKETLRLEGERRANEKFNVVQVGTISYIIFGNVKISPAKYGASTKELIDTLYELRKMYIEQYVESEGRIL